MKKKEKNRKKLLFLSICTLFFVQTIYSQINVDSLLRNQPPSQSDIIGKARALLIDAFVQNDKQKVLELHRYLSENFDQENYITLYPAEKALLFAWSGDFENMLQFIKESDSTYIAQVQKKITPVNAHNFYQTVRERVHQELDIILDDLQVSFLTQEEKDFIAIYLRYYLVNYYGTEEDFDTIVLEINSNTRDFLVNYPNSEFISLLDSYELEPSKWSWGLGFDFGYSAKTGSIQEYFKNGGAIDFYVDAVNKKVLLELGFVGIFGNTREDIIMTDGSVLPKTVNVNITSLYLSFGYRIFEYKRLIVTPTAGIGTAWIYPGTANERSDNPDLKKFNYSYGLTKNFGISMDIRLGKMERMPGQNFIYPSYYGFRLGYKFSYNTLKQAPTFYDGNFHLITAGIYMLLNAPTRVKY